MQVRFTRTRLVEETTIVDVTDDQMISADIDPDVVTDADIEEVAEALNLFDHLDYDEVTGWEDVGDIKVEVYSYR